MIYLFDHKSEAWDAMRAVSQKLDSTLFGVGLREVEDQYCVVVHSSKMPPRILPNEFDALRGCVVVYPPGPPLTESLLPDKTFEIVNRSTCDKPVTTAREVYRRYLEAGRIDERLNAINEAMSLGVQEHTAKKQYRSFREANGLPGAVHPPPVKLPKFNP